MAREHDDDLDVATGPPADGAAIAAAIATGLERIATVLERGLREIREVTRRGRDRPYTTCKQGSPPRRGR